MKAFCCFATILILGFHSSAYAADRPADEVVKDIEAIPRPRSPREMSPEGGAIPRPSSPMDMTPEEIAQLRARTLEEAELIGELRKSHPTDARLTQGLPNRWSVLSQYERFDEALGEINDTLRSTNDPAFKKEVLYSKAQIVFAKAHWQLTDEALKEIDEFTKSSPGDQRAARLLQKATVYAKDESKRKLAEERILRGYGTTPYAAMVKAKRKQIESIGKPFELEFTDAVKDKKVSIKGLKGNVVVLHFWATCCGPCIDEFPTMKKLYAEYKGKGVEFIGVCLDCAEEDGLDALKKCVAKHELGWPQCYQGIVRPGDGFSDRWGVQSIPCIFVIDADGRLATTEGRGKLDKVISELLKKGKL